jgi:hypothetical protein
MLTVEEACNQELDFLLIQEPDKVWTSLRPNQDNGRTVAQVWALTQNPELLRFQQVNLT